MTAGVEVSDILFNYQSSVDKNPIKEKQIESTITVVHFTKELLKAGEVDYIEVLTAEQSLLKAQMEQVNDKLEQLQYSVSL